MRADEKMQLAAAIGHAIATGQVRLDQLKSKYRKLIKVPDEHDLARIEAAKAKRERKAQRNKHDQSSEISEE